MNIPTIASEISILKVIFTEEQQNRLKGQTKEPITFTVEKPGITIPSGILNQLQSDFTYLVQVGVHVRGKLLSLKIKPVFINNTQGEYGSLYRFQYAGKFIFQITGIINFVNRGGSRIPHQYTVLVLKTPSIIVVKTRKLTY